MSRRYVEDVWLLNAVIEARFYTPYTDHNWSHGFFFRDTDRGQYRLVISSDRRYALIYSYPDRNNDWQFERIQAGNLPSYVDLGANSSVLVRIVVQTDTAYLFINNELTGTLDVSRHQSSGSVAIGTGFYTGSEKAGAVTRYEQFTVWRLDLATATPIPPRSAQRLCFNSPPPRLSIGDIGYVVYGHGPSNLNKHPRRSDDQNVVVDIIQEGEMFLVVGGPECGNGLTWWRVRYLKNNFLGWLAEGAGNLYWLDKYR
ncbi:MAG: hypothetical protein ACK4P1_06440 [Aggregatilineales bacterium]